MTAKHTHTQIDAHLKQKQEKKEIDLKKEKKRNGGTVAGEAGVCYWNCLARSHIENELNSLN